MEHKGRQRHQLEVITGVQMRDNDDVDEEGGGEETPKQTSLGYFFKVEL